jgi:hypothetical protein
MGGRAFETAAYAGGGVVALMRPHDEWSATPHARRSPELPLISITKDRRGRAKAVAQGDRPLPAVACSICRA